MNSFADSDPPKNSNTMIEMIESAKTSKIISKILLVRISLFSNKKYTDATMNIALPKLPIYSQKVRDKY